MSSSPIHDSPAPDSGGRTLDDYLANRLPTLTKRERRRMVARGGITINGREVTDVGEPLGSADVVALPPPPTGDRWAETPPKPKPEPGTPRPEASKPRKPRAKHPEAPPQPPIDEEPDGAAETNDQPPAREERAPVRAEPREPIWTKKPGSRHKDEGDRAGAKRFLARGVRLVYEDEELIVIDKAPGLVTADPTQKTADTVFEIVKHYVRLRKGRTRGGAPRVWVIHRLDRDASGLLVFAKSEQAFGSLKEDLRAKRTDRLYYALVEGVVGPPGFTATHQSFLVEARADDTRIRSIAASAFRGAPGRDGKLAVTHYRVVASNPNMLSGTGASLLQVRLDTGRKNQIRVHMADIGHPIVGDMKYGALSDAIGRVGLHAAELGFTHPRTGQMVRFSSPAPGSFYRSVGEKPVREEVDAADRPMTHTFPAGVDTSAGGEVDTSWDRVARWYDDLLSEKQNDHYEEVILPGTLRLIEPWEGLRLLDVGCGQGILGRRLASLGVQVTGVDSSPQLIAAAKKRGSGAKSYHVPTPEYMVADVRDLGPLNLQGFDAAACVMALGNIDPLEPVFKGIAGALRVGGRLVIVIAHPAFRAPGQTSWGWDDKAKTQYRRVEGYLSPGQKQIQMHPGKDASVVTWTFHRPLQAYTRLLAGSGFGIEAIEEWPGQRMSTSGPRAAEENRIRREIPLFMAIRAVKRPEAY